MKSVIVKLQMLLVATAMSACAPLDLRCDDVSERVEMHAGSEWYIYRDITPPEFVDSELMSFRNADGTRKAAKASSYCKNTGRNRQKTPWVPESEADLVGYEAQLLASVATHTTAVTEPSTTESVCEVNGQGPPPGTPQNSQKAKERYLWNRQVYLTPESIGLVNEKNQEDAIEVPVKLFNRSLNCAWASDKLPGSWACEAMTNENINPDHDPLLAACLDPNRKPKNMVNNYIGIVDNWYCLYLGVFEVKPSRGEGMEGGELEHWPTTVANDRLKATIRCAGKETGPVQPGVVVAGPRAYFRSPTVSGPSNAPSTPENFQ